MYYLPNAWGTYFLTNPSASVMKMVRVPSENISVTGISSLMRGAPRMTRDL